jgi:hypothetical protein
MMENYRSGLIWNLMMKSEHVKRGLSRAGVKEKPDYKQGFYLAMINTETKVYDMMRHPDRKQFELNYFLFKVPEMSGSQFPINRLIRWCWKKLFRLTAGEHDF